jgi:hypothetical protein
MDRYRLLRDWVSKEAVAVLEVISSVPRDMHIQGHSLRFESINRAQFQTYRALGIPECEFSHTTEKQEVIHDDYDRWRWIDVYKIKEKELDVSIKTSCGDDG